MNESPARHRGLGLPAGQADDQIQDEGPPPPTRPPHGLRLLVAGLIIATLGPLAGFLGGSMVGQQGPAVAGLTPMYAWMFGGMVIGGVGGIMAIMGALSWVRHRNEDRVQRDAELDEYRKLHQQTTADQHLREHRA